MRKAPKGAAVKIIGPSFTKLWLGARGKTVNSLGINALQLNMVKGPGFRYKRSMDVSNPELLAGVGHPVVLFDGVCHLCQSSVQFLIKRDLRQRLRFASLQSPFGRRLLASQGLDPVAMTSIVFVEAGQSYQESTAALKVAAYLKAPWRFLAWCRVLPRWLRDPVYRWIAKNRYRWFGKDETCWLPTPELQSLFLDRED